METDLVLAEHADRVRGLLSRLEFVRDARLKEELLEQLRNESAAIRRRRARESETVVTDSPMEPVSC